MNRKCISKGNQDVFVVVAVAVRTLVPFKLTINS